MTLEGGAVRQAPQAAVSKVSRVPPQPAVPRPGCPPPKRVLMAPGHVRTRILMNGVVKNSLKLGTALNVHQ